MAADAAVRPLRIRVSPRAGDVGALLQVPDDARALLVLAHGAGADMRHAFLEATARALAARGLGVLRHQFPYTEAGRRRPDPRPVLLDTLRAALEAAASHGGGLPLLAGGKSMGGRMASQLAAAEGLEAVRGIVFFGFPLHPAGRPSRERGEHLRDVRQPLLFLQGSRDRLADLALLRPLVGELGPRAALHVVDDADHSFHVPKRTGRSDAEVLEELADVSAAWSRKVL